MIALRNRNKTFHADLCLGRLRAVRGSLGTRNRDAALQLIHRIEIALAEGPRSTVWAELKNVIPPATFSRLAQHAGVKEKYIPVWKALREMFEANMHQRVKDKSLTSRTVETYVHTLNEFDLFLKEGKISSLQDIDHSIVDAYRGWRLDRAQRSKRFRGGSIVGLEINHLHHVFSFAIEQEFISKNPVRPIPRKYDPTEGAQPFSGDELVRLRDTAKRGDESLFPIVNHDWLLFVLFRWTGFRCSDVVSLKWAEVSFSRREIEKVCQKNRKKVILPVYSDLLRALEAEHERRNPQPSETVLLNPTNGKPYTHYAVYQRLVDLGKRAGVSHVHPHRFRDTHAVDLLLRGADTASVANLLGDTIKVVMERYVPFVAALRERARLLLETGTGLEQYVTPASHSEKQSAQPPHK